MPDELPTINEIVQALTTINDRHFKEMQEIRDEYSRANLKDRDALERADWIIERRDITVEALKSVIDELGETLEKICAAASRDQRDCVLMEPGDVFRMAKVNVKALRESEVRRAKERASLPEATCYSCGDPADHSEAGCDGISLIEQEAGERREMEGEIEALKTRLNEAQAQAQRLFDQNTMYARAIARLRNKVGNDVVEPIVKALTLAQDLNRRQARFKAEGEPVPARTFEQLVADNKAARLAREAEQAAGSPEDLCLCGHKRRSHVPGPNNIGGAMCGPCSNGNDQDVWRHAFEKAAN